MQGVKSLDQFADKHIWISFDTHGLFFDVIFFKKRYPKYTKHTNA